MNIVHFFFVVDIIHIYTYVFFNANTTNASFHEGYIKVFIVLMTLIEIVLPIRSRARRRRKSVHTSTLACGTLNKVARSLREFPAGSKFTLNGNAKLGAGGSNIPTETSKLLLGMDTDGRPVMNSYEVGINYAIAIFNPLSTTTTCIYTTVFIPKMY